MYPLNLKSADGFACANDEAEHIALSDAGYQPAFVATVKRAYTKRTTVDDVRADVDVTDEVKAA